MKGVLIHLLNKYLLSTQYVLGTVLGAGDSAVNKENKIYAFMKLTF